MLPSPQGKARLLTGGSSLPREASLIREALAKHPDVSLCPARWRPMAACAWPAGGGSRCHICTSHPPSVLQHHPTAQCRAGATLHRTTAPAPGDGGGAPSCRFHSFCSTQIHPHHMCAVPTTQHLFIPAHVCSLICNTENKSFGEKSIYA